MRLPNGFGSVIKLGGNRRKPYAARITINFKEDGKTASGIPIVKQKYKYLGYFESQPEALNCLLEYNKSPYDIEASKITFLEVWNGWLENHSSKVSKSSLAVYKTAFKRCESLYKISFSSLRTLHFQKIIDDCPNFSSARVIKIVAGLLYAYAIKKEIVDKDISKLLELPKKPKKQDKNPFTPDHIKIILNKEGDLYADMLIVLLYTGMRISELLEMESKNVDLENRIMIGGLKTEAGKDRSIPIHKKILPIIERNIGSNYLFQSPRGGKYYYSNEGLKINRQLKEWNIDRTIHEARHTFVSQAKKLKIDNLIVKKIVGHSTKDITDHYTHISNTSLTEAIDSFYY